MHTIWTGERVRLRPFNDFDEYNQLGNECWIEPNDHWGPGWWPSGDRKKLYDSGGMLDLTKYSCFAVERLDTGELVGFEEFGRIRPGATSAWLGTEIRRAHWHNGFGIEAKLLMECFLFENFPILNVWADTLESHTRARNGLLACGMSYVGRKRGFFHTSGKYYDQVCYLITRAQWESLPIRQVVKRGWPCM